MKIITFDKGVSVVLCCYNSANRIEQTLKALSLQVCSPTLFWEIVLVDNACTDNTSEMAERIWAGFNSPIKLRIVHEAKPGLANARNCGISNARYSFILFCDDDNWLCSTYVQGIFDILDRDDNIAACGGKGIPVFESTRPSWFDEYAEAYALGSQDITRENGKLLCLYGAGLAIRKKCVERLYSSGFSPILTGRVRKTLSSSEDIELTYAFVLMGYTLEYADNLYFHHFLPAERLSLNYLKKLFVAFGSDGPIRNLYYSNVSKRFVHRQLKHWPVHVALSFVRLLKYLVVPPKRNGRGIYFKWSVAYIKQLLSMRRYYGESLAKITRIQHISTNHSNG